MYDKQVLVNPGRINLGSKINFTAAIVSNWLKKFMSDEIEVLDVFFQQFLTCCVIQSLKEKIVSGALSYKCMAPNNVACKRFFDSSIRVIKLEQKSPDTFEAIPVD